ncbi:hypothetical protein AGMMS49965_25130 [Bacteroidia bacterium]|nr:hypothetical protein AGMMS49965_25130 [Bacteroidia bacterium]
MDEKKAKFQVGDNVVFIRDREIYEVVTVKPYEYGFISGFRYDLQGNLPLVDILEDELVKKK